jgi:hypothetical protein
MIISNIKLTQDNKEITLSADLQFQGEKVKNMFFSTESKNKSYIFVDASPFVAAVLIPCMKTGENIFIDGSISERFFNNTAKTMELFSGWDKKFKKINISANEVTRDKENPKNTACFFSGGVDSFYTYLKHKKEINDFILVHGFDIPLNAPAFFSEVKNVTQEISREANVNLITVKTNIRDIVERKLIWDFTHGGAMAAVGFFLRKNIQKLYIAGAVRKDELFPYGTHPDLDKLWSTEYLSIAHDGTEYNRFEKIINVISKSNLAFKYLRVCPQNIKGKYNCSKCFKCLITMIYLICAKALNKFETFDKKIDLNLVRKMYYNYDLFYNKQGETGLHYLQKYNLEPELQQAIIYSLEKSKKPGFIKFVANKIGQFDQKYNNRRLYRLVFKQTEGGDRNLLFKFLSRHNFLK